MPRKPNGVETKSLRVSTTPQVFAYLEDITETGMYGKNTSEVADRLLTAGINLLINEGVIQRRKNTRKRG